MALPDRLEDYLSLAHTRHGALFADCAVVWEAWIGGGTKVARGIAMTRREA